MDRNIEHRYLNWLGGQVHPNNGKSYEDLYALLHAKEFVWLIPNDDNRIADGFDVRHEYLFRFKKRVVLSYGCSVLEVIVGVSRRLAFICGGDAADWAWSLIENLNLHKMSGHIGPIRAGRIDDILETFIWRTYNPDGSGGMFPLAWPTKDQRKVEIWYQMAAYINEFPEM